MNNSLRLRKLEGTYPDDWSLVPLKDIVYFQEGPGLTSDLFREEGIPFLNIRCIVNGHIQKEKIQYLDPDYIERVYKHFLLNEGDLVFSSSGTIGKVAIVKKTDLPLMLNTSIIRFRSKNEGAITDGYIKVFLGSEHFEIQHKHESQGSAQANVGPTHLNLFYVPLPYIEEQKKIAKIITTVDNLIEKTEALIEKCQAVKQGMMHDLFTRGIDANGQLRPSHHDAPHLYKQTELGWVPKSWDAKRLGELVPPDRPIVYGILMPGYGYPNGIPVIKVKDIKSGEIDKSDLLLTDPEIDMKYKRSKVKHGDLLFTIRGTVGRTAFVLEDLDGANITQDTARITISRGDPRFIRGYLDMPVSNTFIDTHTLGVAVQGINLRDVRRIPIAFPRNEYEQKGIGERIESMERSILNQKKYLEKIVIVKKGLMQDLLTGRVRMPLCEGIEAIS